MRAVGVAALVCAIALGTQTPALLAQEAEESHEEEHGHDNAVALFLGGSTHLRSSGNETGFTIGVEYARRVASWLKIGVLGEYVASEHERDYILLVPFFAHVTRGLVFVAGPGLEKAVPEEGTGHGESEVEFLGRIGAIYEIEVNNWAIGPQINADVAGGHWTLVYGLTFGIGF